MISVHYIVHAVCVAVISILLYHHLWIFPNYNHDVNCVDPLDRHEIKDYNDLPREFEKIRNVLSDDHCTEETSSKDSQASSEKHGLNPSSRSGHKVSPLLAETSILCQGDTYFDRICHFRNLCYNPKEDQFIVFHGNNSVYHGLPNDRFDPALLDLSTVKDHNMHYFNYIDLPFSSISNFNINMVDTPSLIIKRFNSDNIMHVFHDDLLPVYHTLMLTSGSHGDKPRFNPMLVLMEGWPPGQFFHLYKLLSPHEPKLKADLQKSDNITCFENAHVGLLKDTLWYQYGFKVPQAPLPHLRVTARHIRQFTNFILLHLKNTYEMDTPQKERYAVLLSRQYNRRILNEIDITLAIAINFKVKVVTVALETHSLQQIIFLVSRAHILVGMHGSLMALAMFLTPGSIVIELFPYAINPDNYTPYKTLCNLKDMNLIYKSWRNRDVDNTVTFSDESWEVGGITHLSEEEQNDIINSSEVPQHLCCRDPHWLFRIYQDTVVDVASFTKVLQEANDETVRLGIKDHSDSFSQLDMFPSHVRNITCQNKRNILPSSGSKGLYISQGVLLSWKPPWNLAYLNSNDVRYEILIQENDALTYTAWIVRSEWYLLSENIKKDSVYNVWIRCILNNNLKGPFNTEHIACKT